MDETVVAFLFWISIAILVHTWFGYPACLFLLERLLYRPVKKKDCEPTVSVLVLCHNEEDNIGRKLDNLLELDYPREKLNIIVASDGSYDNTTEIVRGYERRGVELREFHTRRGKPSVLADVVPSLSGEVILLADARQRFEPDLLRKIVPNFADEDVGAVSGELAFEHPERAGFAAGMDLYWRYEKWIRMKESGIDSSMGGTGAVFAMRAACFEPIPGETILDDVVLPLRIMRQRKRVVLELGARAWDVLQSSWQREFARKSRTLSGNFQVLANLFSMGMGARFLGLPGFLYLSHKVLRLLGPVCLAVAFYTNALLVDLVPRNAPEGYLYQGTYILQIAFYAAAVCGILLQGRSLRLPILSTAYSFVVMQMAVVTGFLRFVSGRDDVLWEKAHLLESVSIWTRLWRLIWDSSLFTLGFLIAFYVRYWGAPPSGALQSYMQLFPYVDVFGLRLALPLVMLIPMAVFYVFHINEEHANDVTPEYTLVLLKGLLVSTILLFIAVYVRRSTMLLPVVEGDSLVVASMPSSVLLLGFLINCLLIAGWRFACLWYRLGTEEPTEEQREVLLLGADDSCVSASVIEESYSPRARIYSTIPAQSSAQAYRRKLMRTLIESRPNEIVVVSEGLSRRDLIDTVAEADERRLMVSLLPGEFELMVGGTRPRLVCLIPVLEPGRIEVPEVLSVAKRGLDLMAGFVLLLSGTPFFAALWVASRLLGGHGVSVGWAARLGPRGKPVELPRLRYAAGWPSGWRLMARMMLWGYSLLAGRLTLIGYRPLRASMADAIHPWVKRVLRIPPGLVYLPRIQVSGSGRLDKRAGAIVYYMRNIGPALDIRIALSAWRRCRAARRAKTATA